ncbi:MAG: hypothetical protein ACOY9D_12755 [Pseudomonadota bacterium]
MSELMPPILSGSAVQGLAASIALTLLCGALLQPDGHAFMPFNAGMGGVG